MIPQTEFRQVLDHFCMRLSDVQFRKLLSELRINEGEEIMVDWKEFLQVFNLHKQEVKSFLWLSFMVLFAQYEVVIIYNGLSCIWCIIKCYLFL